MNYVLSSSLGHCCRRRTRTANLSLMAIWLMLYQLSYTAYRYRVLYYSHSIKPVPVAGREAHIHLCLVSVVRSSTSGLLVASDTDSSPAPSSRPSSLQFVAVGIRRPRRQSYVVFQYVKEPFPLFIVEGAGVEPAAHPKRSGNHRMRYGVRGF